MSLILPPRRPSPQLMAAFVDAVKRTERFIFAHPGSGARYGALNALIAVSKRWDGPGVPYDVFLPRTIFPVTESWAVFQLYEAIQLRAEWQFLQPEHVRASDVLAAFNAVNAEIGNIFLECDATPAARRAILGIPFFHGDSARDGWVISLRKGVDLPVIIQRPGFDFVIHEEPPPTVFFNDVTRLWDTQPI